MDLSKIVTPVKEKLLELFPFDEETKTGFKDEFITFFPVRRDKPPLDTALVVGMTTDQKASGFGKIVSVSYELDIKIACMSKTAKPADVISTWSRGNEIALEMTNWLQDNWFKCQVGYYPGKNVDVQVIFHIYAVLDNIPPTDNLYSN